MYTDYEMVYIPMSVFKSAKVHARSVVAANLYKLIIVVKALSLERLVCPRGTVTPHIHRGAKRYQGNLLVWVFYLQSLKLSEKCEVSFTVMIPKFIMQLL